MFFSELDICCPMSNWPLLVLLFVTFLSPTSPTMLTSWVRSWTLSIFSSFSERSSSILILMGSTLKLFEGILTILVTRRFFRSTTMNFGGTFVKASLLTLLSFRRFLVWIWALHCLIRHLFLSFPSPPCFFMSWNSRQIWQSSLRHPGQVLHALIIPCFLLSLRTCSLTSSLSQIKSWTLVLTSVNLSVTAAPIRSCRNSRESNSEANLFPR